jgi:predicted GNAT family acetyltransferase
MGWELTDDHLDYIEAAGEFLRMDPAENTVQLSVLETLRRQGGAAFAGAVFGWWTARGDRVEGAFLVTPPHPLLLSGMPIRAARELAAALAARGVKVQGVNADHAVARAFADARHDGTGATGRVAMRQRLYRLERLEPPDPLPGGDARIAGAADHALVRSWYEAFHRESLGSEAVNPALVDDRLADGGIALWENGGEAVSMAGRTGVVAGMTRVAPVYTPPRHRRHGYGAAATLAITRSALAAGARTVVLFTDLANPTSNGIYQKLGYRPVSDRLVLSFVTG